MCNFLQSLFPPDSYERALMRLPEDEEGAPDNVVRIQHDYEVVATCAELAEAGFELHAMVGYVPYQLAPGNFYYDEACEASLVRGIAAQEKERGRGAALTLHPRMVRHYARFLEDNDVPGFVLLGSVFGELPTNFLGMINGALFVSMNARHVLQTDREIAFGLRHEKGHLDDSKRLWAYEQSQGRDHPQQHKGQGLGEVPPDTLLWTTHSMMNLIVQQVPDQEREAFVEQMWRYYQTGHQRSSHQAQGDYTTWAEILRIGAELVDPDFAAIRIAHTSFDGFVVESERHALLAALLQVGGIWHDMKQYHGLGDEIDASLDPKRLAFFIQAIRAAASVQARWLSAALESQ